MVSTECPQDKACIKQKCRDPCPGTCGLHTRCQVINHNAICSCSKGFVGDPFVRCIPEQSKHVMLLFLMLNNNNIFKNYYYLTLIILHSCCIVILFLLHDLFIIEPLVIESTNPCVPSPCGPNSHCQALNSRPVCSCMPYYLGRPPHCRPDCTINADCAGNQACQSERCRDPCPGSCGPHTKCVVVKHAPICFCENDFTGDPFGGCTPLPQSKKCFRFS